MVYSLHMEHVKVKHKILFVKIITNQIFDCVTSTYLKKKKTVQNRI